MKPAWDKLMAEYKDSKTVLVADVDCTGEGKPLCDANGVEGFPTIKHGSPDDLENYEGERDFKGLQKFAKENLGPRCGPENLDLCDADKKGKIETFNKMTTQELKDNIQEAEKKMAGADTELETLLKSLQAQYEEATKKKDETKKNIKESGLGLMKAVMASRKQSGKEEL